MAAALSLAGARGNWAARLASTCREDIDKGSTFEDVAKTAAWLEENLATLEDDPALDEDSGEESGEEGDDTVSQLLDGLMDAMRYEGTRGRGHNKGQMTIERPALSIPVRPDRKVRGKRSAEEGDSLRDATRLMTDGRVFAGRRKKVGGSVLVDTSGSMSWSSEDLIAVVSTAPAALVGAYSGSGGRGVLRIVARGGRRVPDDQVNPTRGGNEVDIPALEWLAQQREPRVWMSDGQVCGQNQDEGWLLMQAARICRTARIRRVRIAEEIPAALAGRAGEYGGYEEAY
jgi:hypothetical protein